MGAFTVPFNFPLIAQLLYWSCSEFAYSSTSSGPLGYWEDCPTDFSTYTGCNETIKSFFSLNTSAATCDDLHFRITVNSTTVHSVRVVKNTTNCTVFGTIDDVPKGNLTVHFIAHEYGTLDQDDLYCPDHVIAEDIPFPSNMTSKVTCNELRLDWLAPDDVLPGYSIDGYFISITDKYNEAIYVNTTNDTNLIIKQFQSTAAFEINERYEVSIKTMYCGGLTSNGSLIDEIKIADVPEVSSQFIYSFTNNPSTHTVWVDLKTNVLHINCPISHPTSYTIMLNCSKMPYKSMTKNLTVNEGNIMASFEIPNGENCNGLIKWMNSNKATDEANITISVSYEQFFRANFTSSNKHVLIYQYTCYVSCCCTNNGSCSCYINSNANQPEYAISDVTLVPNDELSCDDRYYLSCKKMDMSPASSICISCTITSSATPNNTFYSTFASSVIRTMQPTACADAKIDVSANVIIGICVTVLGFSVLSNVLFGITVCAKRRKKCCESKKKPKKQIKPTDHDIRMEKLDKTTAQRTSDAVSQPISEGTTSQPSVNSESQSNISVTVVHEEHNNQHVEEQYTTKSTKEQRTNGGDDEYAARKTDEDTQTGTADDSNTPLYL